MPCPLAANVDITVIRISNEAMAPALQLPVAQNIHEIGIRLALGAETGNILGMVLWQGLKLAGIGIGAGLIGAMALTRVMASLLFQLSVLDWVTFGSVALVLAVVAVGATVIPAARAMRIDSTVALREL